ncbi:MAG: FHA domain-containing protein [Deltaproteobacteria bacterium]|nr:FHA domain-containing protein [Deltaproteobacteria bacterium]
MEDRNNNSKVIDFKSAGRDGDRPFNSKFANYKPDEELLQATTRIKNQRDVILERIQKMDEARGRVSQSVYDKVKRDYDLQLQTINDLLQEKKELLKKEIKDLYVRREKLSVEINRHKEILEEADFRYFLSEFSHNQFQEVETYETKEIEKLESDLARISQYIRSHEDLFDPEDLGRRSASEPSSYKPKEPEYRGRLADSPKQQETAPATEPQPQRAPEQSTPEEDYEFEPSVNTRANMALEEGGSVIQPEEETIQPPQPKESQDESSEFEDLFLEEDSEDDIQIEESQSNINRLLQDEPQKGLAEEDINDLINEPQEDSLKTDSSENYFANQDVSEQSFTLKKESGADLTGEELTPNKDEAKLEQNESIADDSISDILSSIKVDENAEKKTESVGDATGEIPLSTETSDAPYILRLTEGELEQTVYELKANTSIGRSPSNDVILKAPKVSRQHAAINVYNNQYIIIDLKSSNGVYVNGNKVDEAVLQDGDEVSIGGYRFSFSKK